MGKPHHESHRHAKRHHKTGPNPMIPPVTPPSASNNPYETIDVLNTISATISQSPHLTAALDATLERLLKLTEADIGSIHILDSASQDLVLCASRGVTQSFIYTERRIPMGACLCGLAVRLGEVVVSNDLSKEERLSRSACRDERFGSMISVPLRAREKTLGILTLYSKRTHAFDHTDRPLLIAISHHIGVAVENSQLASKTIESALQEERWLIAQELHDNIAQSLAYLNMQTKLLEGRFPSDLKAPILDEFHQIRSVIQDTYQDVRSMLIDFRIPMKEGETLEDALRRYCREFSSRTGIQTEFLSDADLPQFEPSVQTQIFRIIQESLSNVRKHARAKKVSVAVRIAGSGLRITVQDDGEGFDPTPVEDPARQRMGLSIMQERAANLRGTVRISTVAGQGTSVQIEIPVNRPHGS
jgi:two-component system nitrate/nitrite sensor histidine kinase NarX